MHLGFVGFWVFKANWVFKSLVRGGFIDVSKLKNPRATGFCSRVGFGFISGFCNRTNQIIGVP